MELKEFIKANLMQINDAIKEIKLENDELAISIAPCAKTGADGETKAEYDSLDYVEFDVCVETSKKGGFNVSNIISGNADKQTNNRIKFRIPVIIGMKQYNNRK